MRNFIRLLLIPALLLSWPDLASPAYAEGMRIKDITTVEGVRPNQLVGYGLVVGLSGTGDSLSNSPFTEQSLIGMLERLGVNARGQGLKTKNVAAVMVTGTLPAFARQGNQIDVSVSALGDAKTLTGGTLLVTPLLGADGEVYAVAQGAIATAAGDGKAGGSRGLTTDGRISNGGLVERAVDFDFSKITTVRLSLRKADFTTAGRIAAVINAHFGAGFATAEDSGTVSFAVPPAFRGDVVGLMGQIEVLRVDVDEAAKVVIDDDSGIIIMGSNVRIRPVAIAQGNLSIKIGDATPEKQSPAGLAPSITSKPSANRPDRIAVIPEAVTLQSLVANLNALGVSPNEMIKILEALKAEGALQAEIERL